tara:strand:+ start:1678 stop:2001 length:324 start_codon:yes stop_codon:yes gene_type:complete
MAVLARVAGVCTRMNNNLMTIHPVHHSVAVEVEASAQAAPLTYKFWKGVVDGISHNPAHIVLFDVASTASSAKNHQEEIHVNSAVSQHTQPGSHRQSVEQGGCPCAG